MQPTNKNSIPRNFSNHQLTAEHKTALVAAIVAHPTEQNFAQLAHFLNFEEHIPEYDEVAIINVENEREGKNLNVQEAKELFAILLKYAGQKREHYENTTEKLAPISFAALDLFTDLTIFDEQFQDVVEKKSFADLLKLHLHQHVIEGNEQQRKIAAKFTLFVSRNIKRFEDWKKFVKVKGQAIMTEEMNKLDSVHMPMSRLSMETHLPQSGKYYDVRVEQICGIFKTDCNVGLTDADIARRRKQYGINQVVKPKRPWIIWMFIRQFLDFMMIILMIAAIVSAAIQEFKATVVLALVVLFNALVGFVQDFRAEKALAALMKMHTPQASIIRQSKVITIDAEELVPGDVVLLEEGSQVPADLRLMEQIDLHIVEALLTGEAEPIQKTILPIMKRDVPIAKQKSMAFMSTVVTKGRGKGVVVATGKQTEMGKIARYLGLAKPRKTPLERRLMILGIILVIVSIVLCGAIVGIGILQGNHWYDMIKVGVRYAYILVTLLSLAVSVIPEGLVAVTTVTMALGVQRMSKKNAIVRSLPAVETLGSVTVICSDKTGTLTENRMTANEFTTINGSTLVNDIGDVPSHSNSQLMLVGALCNNTVIQKNEKNEQVTKGDPTEVALAIVALKYKLDKQSIMLNHQAKFVTEFAFDSDRKRMTVVFDIPQQNHEIWRPFFKNSATVDGPFRIIVTKGATESALSVCSTFQIEPGLAAAMTAYDRQQFEKQNADNSKRGLRVLGLAFRVEKVEFNVDKVEDVEKDLTFAGFVSIYDPPRLNVAKAIKCCNEAGIKVCMITGDNPFTAKSIAEILNIIPANSADHMIIKGKDVDELVATKKLATLTPFPQVFARVSPGNKYQVVEALQKKGEVVAMIGDGANDSSSIRKADVGVAMGKAGTDIAKQAASIILADDNFETVVEAVREGRRTFDNIRKFVMYLLSCNFAEIMLMFIAVSAKMPFPMTSIQILYANLIADVPPSLSLGIEPAAPDLMQRLPRDPKSGLFTIGGWIYLVFQGVIMCSIALTGLCIAVYVEGYNAARASSFTFSLLTIVQLVHAFHSRSTHRSLFQINPFSNWVLILAVLFSFGCLVAGIYIPSVNTFLDLVPLDWWDWVKILIGVVVHCIVMEVVKLVRKLLDWIMATCKKMKQYPSIKAP